MTQMNVLCPVCGDSGTFSRAWALAPPNFQHFADVGQVDFPCGHIRVAAEDQRATSETIEEPMTQDHVPWQQVGNTAAEDGWMVCYSLAGTPGHVNVSLYPDRLADLDPDAFEAWAKQDDTRTLSPSDAIAFAVAILDAARYALEGEESIETIE